MKTFINKKRAFVLIALSAFAVLLSSCKKDVEQEIEPIEYGNAKMSVTNTVSGSNAQDFYQNDTKLTTAAVAYAQTSPYLTLKAGNSVISFRNAGSTAVSVALQAILNTDLSYTVFYYVDQSGTARMNGFSDDQTAPAAGKIKVRFVNLAPALNNTLNVSLADNTALVNGLSFGNANTNGYLVLDATAALQVSVVNSGISVPIPATNFTSGKIYTIWFDAATTTTAKFHVIQQN
ncbi:DUF4397 domain-containing protein [Pedobacter cryotolerans]|uniref:DUF4397 domain-containing protein n=1 Tax=Pedobacter cryotolerans TaxID=2571270 RepID=A0A4V5NYH8_9SPHI|nr:DUF4397 domain-containing protein [Pedobacter cryotolerans]TKC02487.1 DUF4397 domain-containing protein [Pedobacter cryotolerans]